ncbi:hypothetical protein F5B19DRAFT_111 [Rostrohypoxylon terebratum]|nr:hypothetical protein F5B19DRAFT_111 [Rostrohypoxylon terebratum]
MITNPIDLALSFGIFLEHQQGIATFHYLLSLRGIELEGLWSNSSLIQLMTVGCLTLTDGEGKLQNIDQHLGDWMSICRFVDVDLSIPGQINLLNQVVWDFSGDRGNPGLQIDDNSIDVFDAIVRLGISIPGSPDPLGIPTAYAADCLYDRLGEFFAESLVAREASHMLSVSYRDYYVHPWVARRFEFLEHVISKGIAQRPDSMFDVCYGETPSDRFYYSRWTSIWEDILEENGFDVNWVYEEDERRLRVVTGETTAHEVSVNVDASRTFDLKRRRGYENSDD